MSEGEGSVDVVLVLDVLEDELAVDVETVGLVVADECFTVTGLIECFVVVINIFGVVGVGVVVSVGLVILVSITSIVCNCVVGTSVVIGSVVVGIV